MVRFEQRGGYDVIATISGTDDEVICGKISSCDDGVFRFLPKRNHYGEKTLGAIVEKLKEMNSYED